MPESELASRRAEILTRTMERLSTASELSTVTEVVASAVRALAVADGATFVLREDDKCFYADEDAIGPLWKGQKFPLTACVSGWCMLHKEVVVIGDIYTDPRVPVDAYRPTFVKSMCMVPIRAADPIGAVGCYWSKQHEPSADDVHWLQVVANSAAVALENLELRGAIVRRATERDDLASRKRELENAIHSLVHDLRNPLGVMMGFAELLEGRLPDERARQLYARHIVESGGQLLRQVDRMLSLYRITNQPIQPTAVDLSSVARDLAAGLTAAHPERHIEFAVDAGIRATVDPVLARLMLDNLLSNAVKYTGKTSEARIELREAARNAREISFFVRDNGAGFDATDAHRLFRPMTRLHSDAEFPGTGLGLASVARIAELHGGRVHAEGAKGEGATFSVTLPAAPG